MKGFDYPDRTSDLNKSKSARKGSRKEIKPSFELSRQRHQQTATLEDSWRHSSKISWSSHLQQETVEKDRASRLDQLDKRVDVVRERLPEAEAAFNDKFNSIKE